GPGLASTLCLEPNMLQEAFLYFRILLLLGGINLAPALLGYLHRHAQSRPLDQGRRLGDSQPIFGPGKTVWGLCSALLAGPLLALILFWPWWLGLACAMLSMLGDLGSSFAKRRLHLPRGTDLPVLDHLPESALPLIPLAAYLQLGLLQCLLLLAIFCLAGWQWTKLYKQVLLQKPFAWYPRPLSPRVRLKELASCRESSSFWGTVLHFEEAIYYHLLLQGFFRVTGLYPRGMANALCFQVQELSISLPDLPRAFDGYSILFLCDLHLDGLPGLTERLLGVLDKLRPDLCLLGGDYRMRTHGTYQEALGHLRRLLQKIHAPDGTLAVLGNHDCLEMVDTLYSQGARVLINDSCRIERSGQHIWIAGVDDPHYYKCHDTARAFQEIPADGFCLFLAHSPVLYQEAQSLGASLYLAGHTHAGQIQLPPWGPVFTHCPAPRSFCTGFWTYQGLLGYTSPGVGVSGVPVRFNCSGEVTMLTLHQGPKQYNSQGYTS
ncbi:MAG: CDP-archaeol synthase, partial [Desulfohalobiaceae bacterium]